MNVEEGARRVRLRLEDSVLALKMEKASHQARKDDNLKKKKKKGKGKGTDSSLVSRKNPILLKPSF